MNSPATVQRYFVYHSDLEPDMSPDEGSRVYQIPVLKWEDHCRALEAVQKEIAELRGKVWVNALPPNRPMGDPNNEDEWNWNSGYNAAIDDCRAALDAAAEGAR